MRCRFRGTNAVNSSTLTLVNGVLLIVGTESVVAGSIIIGDGASISINTGGEIKPGASIWAPDIDNDGYPDTTNTAFYTTSTTVGGAKRRGAMTTLTTVDCNPSSYSTTNACGPTNYGDGHDGAVTFSANENINTNNDTSSLLHFNGLDAATTFTDASNKTWTAAGNAQIDTAQSKIGGASSLFDGTGDWIDTPDNDDFNTGSGNFSIDLWVKRNTTGTRQAITGQSDAAGSNTSGWIEFTATNTIRGIVNKSDNSVAYIAASTGTITDSNWHHIAFVRDGNTLRLFKDGVADGTADVTGITLINSPSKFAIGRGGEYADLYFNGWVDEFRYSKGIARWTANFTPPTTEYSNRAIADGEALAVSAISTNTVTLTGTGTDGTAATSASTSLAANDEVMLINLQGDATNNGNVGVYETFLVQSVSSATVTFTTNVTGTYGVGGNSTLTGQKIVLQRVPNYTNVTVNSGITLTANAWNGTTGGIVAFKASGTVTVTGTISAAGLGYLGGDTVEDPAW